MTVHQIIAKRKSLKVTIRSTPNMVRTTTKQVRHTQNVLVSSTGLTPNAKTKVGLSLISEIKISQHKPSVSL